MRQARLSTRIILVLIVTAISLLASCSNKQDIVNIETIPQIPDKQVGEVYLEGKKVCKTQRIHDNDIIAEPLILKDNPQSQNVALYDLIDFLGQTRPKRDEMGRNVVRDFYEGRLYYTCGYYVEEIHNDAEARGIKAGIAILKTIGEEYHAINVFQTTDRGVVYVDGSYLDDKIFDLIFIGQIFEVYGNYITIEKIEIIWEGYAER